MSSAAARSPSTMPRITVQTHATLDGVIEAAPAEAYQPYFSDEGMRATIALAQAAEALLLGRETWQHLAKAWRSERGAIADRLNAMPKYVVSSTLKSADDWDNTTIVAYDEISGLRARMDLLSYGCGGLARDLLGDGLLDELRIWLTPVVAGRGRRLFDEPTELMALK